MQVNNATVLCAHWPIKSVLLSRQTSEQPDWFIYCATSQQWRRKHIMTGPARLRAWTMCELYAKLLLSQNFCNQPLMRFISFASNIGTAAAVPDGTGSGAPGLAITIYLQLTQTCSRLLQLEKVWRAILTPTPLTVMGNTLHQVSSFKYLGVWITKDLSWSKHVSEICIKGDQINLQTVLPT